MQHLRPEIAQRYFPNVPDPLEGAKPGAATLEPPKVAWAFPCINPLCDTELVVPPENTGCWVECPTCGLRFIVPRAAPAEVLRKPAAPQLTRRESKAATALELLAERGRSLDEFPPPAHAGVLAPVANDRRTKRRLPLGPQPEVRPAPAPTAARPAGLALTWVVALLATAGTITVGYVSEIPDLGLGAILFVGLAAVRTAWVCRGRRTSVE